MHRSFHTKPALAERTSERSTFNDERSTFNDECLSWAGERSTFNDERSRFRHERSSWVEGRGCEAMG
jgi:hypothetical protein